MNSIIDNYKDIEDIKKMTFEELNTFSGELRNFLITNVSKTGGHLASNLGVVELTLSLYKVFDFNTDKLIWDVGHQSYVHKILTGRKDRFDTLRKYGGISGFPKISESKYDFFGAGHSSTSISAALGMARARDIECKKYNVVSVIGDGALTGGMAFEALNDVGFRKTKMIIILNDNQMSIGKNVGGMSTYLNQLRLSPRYNKLKQGVNQKLEKTIIGKGIMASINKFKGSIKHYFVPDMLFEDMGVKYLGPIDGHNIKELTRVLSKAKNLNEPVLIHVITKKGKGYDFAENNPNKFHGIGPFNLCNGEISSDVCETYSSVFGEEMCTLAEKNKKIVAITAAMKDGTGLANFAKKHEKRFFDVGIAEQHAVTMAAGMAKEGLKPVFVVYSTFLQRAYDQIINDVCIQKLPVIFAIDRAGIVGEDGETHQGIFDLSYLLHMPNMTVMAPKCMGELKTMLDYAVDQDFPIAIRYPRGKDIISNNIKPIMNIEYGKWEYIEGDSKTAIIACGEMVQFAILAREKLLDIGIDVTIISACFAKPIDKSMLKGMIQKYKNIVTVEDNVIQGGLGSSIVQYINSLNTNIRIMNLGYNDIFIKHGNRKILYNINGLDDEGIKNAVLKILE